MFSSWLHVHVTHWSLRYAGSASAVHAGSFRHDFYVFSSFTFRQVIMVTWRLHSYVCLYMRAFGSFGSEAAESEAAKIWRM